MNISKALLLALSIFSCESNGLYLRRDDLSFVCEYYREKHDKLSDMFVALRDRLNARNIRNEEIEENRPVLLELIASLIPASAMTNSKFPKAKLAKPRQEDHNNEEDFLESTENDQESADPKDPKEAIKSEVSQELGCEFPFWANSESSSSTSSASSSDCQHERIAVRKRYSDFFNTVTGSCQGLSFPTTVNISNSFQISDIQFDIAIQRAQKAVKYLKNEKLLSMKSSCI